ncbi:MAG: enoyl-CoA hydratase [Flavobacteriales bacterium]|nr:enoyl-CoA hydratase [Flavobacteriales bacterium]MBO72605.1 enoyl-CoA hydratase [Flavobacteriales bacterium]
MKPYVKSKILNGLGEIEFYHPKSNSLPALLLNNLSEEIIKLGEEPSVKCIVLKSSGKKTFCAGASFDELLLINNENQGKDFFMGFAKVIAAIKNAPKIVVSVVQGKVVGGGLGLVCASDYVLAHKSADLKLSELSIGIGPFVIAPVLQRKLGLANFINLSLNPKQWKSATWGLDKGIYSEIFSSHEVLNIRLTELVKDYVNYSPEAVQEIKFMFWDGFHELEKDMEKRAAQSGRLVLSDYTVEVLKKIKFKE